MAHSDANRGTSERGTQDRGTARGIPARVGHECVDPLAPTTQVTSGQRFRGLDEWLDVFETASGINVLIVAHKASSNIGQDHRDFDRTTLYVDMPQGSPPAERAAAWTYDVVDAQLTKLPESQDAGAPMKARDAGQYRASRLAYVGEGETLPKPKVPRAPATTVPGHSDAYLSDEFRAYKDNAWLLYRLCSEVLPELSTTFLSEYSRQLALMAQTIGAWSFINEHPDAFLKRPIGSEETWTSREVARIAYTCDEGTARRLKKLRSTNQTFAAVLPRLHFKLNEPSSNNAKGGVLISAHELDELAGRLRTFLEKAPPQGRLHVYGHTDSIGSPSHNLALSERRARWTINELGKRGFDVNRFDSHGCGAEHAPPGGVASPPHRVVCISL